MQDILESPISRAAMLLPCTQSAALLVLSCVTCVRAHLLVEVGRYESSITSHGRTLGWVS